MFLVLCFVFTFVDLLFLELVSCTRFSFVFVQKEYVFLSDLRISYEIFWDVALSKERSVKKVSIYYILRDCKSSEEAENEGNSWCS